MKRIQKCSHFVNYINHLFIPRHPKNLPIRIQSEHKYCKEKPTEADSSVELTYRLANIAEILIKTFRRYWHFCNTETEIKFFVHKIKTCGRSNDVII